MLCGGGGCRQLRAPRWPAVAEAAAPGAAAGGGERPLPPSPAAHSRRQTGQAAPPLFAAAAALQAGRRLRRLRRRAVGNSQAELAQLDTLPDLEPEARDDVADTANGVPEITAAGELADSGSLNKALPSLGRTRVPNSHLVTDAWFDKVGMPMVGNSSSSRHRGPVPEAAHLAEGHVQSFDDFMRRGLRSQIEQVKNLARLSPQSVVFITREEAMAREVDVELVKKEGLPPGVRAVKLGSLVGDTLDKSRFSIDLLPELMYFRAPSITQDQARRTGVAHTTTAVVPARVSDAVTDFSFEAHIELGSFPLMNDSGLFIVNGNPYVLVHRLVKGNAAYYSVKVPANPRIPRRHTIELVTSSYGRLKVLAEKGQVFFLMPGSKKKLPALYFLPALGATSSELRQLRNYKRIVAKEVPSITEACQALCDLMEIPTLYFDGDPVKTFSIRLENVSNAQIGKTGRRRYNERLGLTLPEDQHSLTRLDVLAAADLVLDADRGVRALQVDDIDGMDMKRLRSPGEVFENLAEAWIDNMLRKAGALPVTVDAFTGMGQLDAAMPRMQQSFLAGLWKENNWQLCDDTNCLSEMMMACRVSQVGDQGLDAVKRIKALRLIHPTQYGRICPIETGEGQNAGVSMTMASYARVTPDGEIVVPHQRVVDGRRMLDDSWEYMQAEKQNQFSVAQFDNAHRPDGTLCAPLRADTGALEDGGGLVQSEETRLVTTVHLGMFTSSPLSRVDYIQCASPLSAAVATIPFLEHDDANRIQMGAKMQQQAVPTLWPERPLVGSGIEAHIASCSSWNAFSGISGQVLYADSTVVSTVSSSVVEEEEEEMPPTSKLPNGWVETKLQVRSEMDTTRLVDAAANKKHTLRHHTCAVSPGASVSAGEVLGEGTGFSGGDMAIGKNLVVAYIPFEGYNYEDAIVVSKRCIREDILTSVHVEEIHRKLDADQTVVDFLDESQEPSSVNLHEGLVREGTWVEEGDILFSMQMLVEYREDGSMMPGEVLTKIKHVRVPPDTRGRVVDAYVENNRLISDMGKTHLGQVVHISIAITSRVQVGDKLSGRHGNKGIVAIIVDDRDMPYLPDGTPVDVCLNPLGVPSRMNVGQIFECLLGSAARWTGQEYRVGQFDEMYAEEASRGLVFDALRKARDRTGYQWLLDPASPGKTRLYDGKTGRPFDQPVTAGISYILKLYHMVRDKIVSRGNPARTYQNLTMQPVRGRTREGGQRFGEMEVSAMIGHGASRALQEMMTIKSDDIDGRAEADDALKQAPDSDIMLPEGTTPEGYRTFRSELAGAGFRIGDGAAGRRPPPRGVRRERRELRWQEQRLREGRWPREEEEAEEDEEEEDEILALGGQS